MSTIGKTLTTLFTLGAVLAGSAGLSAQIGEDPREKIREKLAQIQKGMREVDNKLRETGSTDQAAAEMKRNVKRIEELLKNVGEAQKKVVKDIEELIKQLQQLPRSGRSQQQQDRNRQRQRNRQQQDQQRRQRQRRLMEEPPRQRQGRQPEDNRQRPNEPPEKNPASVIPKRGTEKIDHQHVADPWGDLPKYIMRHRRGSSPEVPEKYRKYLEALMKQKKNKR